MQVDLLENLDAEELVSFDQTTTKIVKFFVRTHVLETRFTPSRSHLIAA